MSKQRLVLVATSIFVLYAPVGLAQTAPLDLDRATRAQTPGAATRARAVQTAAMRERDREQDEIISPPKFLERLFGGLPPFPPQLQFDPTYAPDNGFSGRRDEASYAPEERRPIDPKYLPQTVPYDGPEKPGTIIVDTPNRYLYFILADGTARRYGIGVGRAGFTWSGVAQISAKREWPDWIPPDEMRARRPDLPHFMAGGPENPLGARAMYLGATLYRIHGSNEPWTIGSAVSSGCIRMRNEDVIDLYNRAKIGTRVVVI